MIGAAAATLEGEPGPRDYRAAYPGLQDQSVSVLVDVPPNLTRAYPGLADHLTRVTGAAIDAAVPAASVTGPASAADLEATLPNWASMPPRRLVQRLGTARLVVIDVSRYQLRASDAELLWRGEVEALVRVHEAESVDADNAAFAERVTAAFPSDSEFGVTGVTRPTVEAELASAFAKQIRQLFADHQR